MPASSCSRSSSYIRDRPSEAASSPGASGDRSSRPVSAALTIVASRSNGGVARPNSSTITSKVQRSPRWLQNTFSISKGTALKRSPTATTSAGVTNRNTAFGSTNRRISQGQAMRSIFGLNVDMPQPGRGTLREFLATQADDNRRTPRKFLAPVGGLLVVTPDRAGNQPLVGGKILVGAHVDQGRRLGRTDQACKLIRRYRCVG